MSYRELLSPEGLRVDGRRATELRHIDCAMGIFTHTDGSAFFKMGNTLALAAVYGPREPARGKPSHSRASIECSFTMATFSTPMRKKTTKDRNTTDVAVMLKQIFESVILTSLYPGSVISVFVQILQSDGGVRPCAINAATLALVNAGIPMKDLVCACSAGAVDGTPLLDLNNIEESAGGAELPIALLPKTSTVSLVQLTSKLALAQFKTIVDLASDGCRGVHTVMVAKIKEHETTELQARGSAFANSVL
ncbi:exosome component 4 [Pelomyxa schiedti]|nr:exosome component 4 [Pelomyxa schiedti]